LGRHAVDRPLAESHQARHLIHLPALDGVRAVAFLLVVFAHINLSFGGENAGEGWSLWVSKIFRGGWVGVDLFFVLSGFLITRILLDARQTDGYFRNFYARRALRIFPLYYGFLALMFALAVVKPDRFHYSTADQASLLLYYYNFHAAFHTGLTGVHHFWSLAVEEHFYLFWPAAVYFLRVRSLAKLSLAMIALSLTLRVMFQYGNVVGDAELAEKLTYMTTPCRLDGFAVGGLAAIAFGNASLWQIARRWSPPVAVVCSGILLAIFLAHGQFANSRDLLTYGITALSALFGTVVVFAASASPASAAGRALAWGPLRSIGKYSYGMYVFHMPMRIVPEKLMLTAWPGFATIDPAIAKTIGGLLLLAMSYAAAVVSFHVYEKHFLKLKKHFEYRRPRQGESIAPAGEGFCLAGGHARR
jgi:peptidoglycan/LPS O-acetylase OafA/YrhL